MKILLSAVTVLSVVALSLSAPAVDDNTIETDDAPAKLDPIRVLLGTFNMFDSNLKDLTEFIDIVNDLVALTKGYERTCVLNKLNIHDDDTEFQVEDVDEKPAVQVMLAITLCVPDMQDKLIAIYKKIAPFVKKYLEDDVKPNQLECARQLLLEIEPESPLLAEKTSYGECDKSLTELVTGYSSEAVPMINKINADIDENCPYMDDVESFKKSFVKIALVLFGDYSEDVKIAEIRRQLSDERARAERFLKCSLSH
jgi:hypothetical protein